MRERRLAGAVDAVADVEDAQGADADDGDDAGGEEALVDGLEGVGLALLGLHGVHAGDGREHPDGAGGQREDEAERRVGTDGGEAGDAEDDRRHQGDLVALEQVGGHAGAVAHVVAHVVGDGGGVARVVLGDARFDLADEVGADVGGLGEDATADPEEQRQQGATEAEADEDRRAGVLEEGDDHGGAEEAQTHGEHARDAAGAEGHLQGLGEGVALGGGRGADVAPGGQRHADVAGEAGHDAAGDEGEGPSRPGLGEGHGDVAVGLLDLRRRDEDDRGQWDHDHGDRLELAAEVRGGALLDRLGDLDHLRRALVLGEDVLHQDEADTEGEDGGDSREQEDRPLTPVQYELLVAAFCGQDAVHACFLWVEPRSTLASAAVDVDLAGDSFAQGAVLPVDGDHERAVEGVLLHHHDLDAGDEPEGAEEGDEIRVGRAREGDLGHLAWLQPVEVWGGGQLGGVDLRDREAMGTGGGPVQRHEEALEHLVGQLVLEPDGELVGLVPGVAEHVGEEPFDDAVAADRRHGGLLAERRERHALIGPVVDEAPIGQPLHRGGDGAGGQAEHVGEGAGVRLGAVAGQAVDGLEGLSL